jgi:DNA-binding beta-propeller fold protein YncE
MTSALLLIATAAYAQTAAVVLTPGTPVAIPGASGSFDYMTVDPVTNRVFASHPAAGSLVVLDIKKNEARQIDLKTEVNGVAVDANDGKFFTAGGGGKLFDLNRKTLKIQNTIDLDGPADSILFVADNDTLYIDNDDGTKIWAVNGKTDKVTATITIAGAPEYMAYSPASKQLFQNIKATDQVQAIDTTTNAVTASWATAPETKPHGLVFDPVSNRLFSAGKNKTLAVIDASNGNVVSTVTLASATDQIAFDAKLRRIYAPGGGFITVVGVANDGTATVLGQVTINPKAHTLAVDPNTSTVWISYPDGDTSYLQSFTPAGA